MRHTAYSTYGREASPSRNASENYMAMTLRCRAPILLSTWERVTVRRPLRPPPSNSSWSSGEVSVKEVE